MDSLKNVSLSIALFIAGVLFLALGLTGGFTVNNYNLSIQESWIRIISSVIGIILIGLAVTLDLKKSALENKASTKEKILTHAEKISQSMVLKKSETAKEKASQESSAVTKYKNVHEAWEEMMASCKAAETISIMGIRGLTAFGTDHSLISMSKIDEFKNLRKLRILLLSDDSRWLNPGYIQLRNYESIELFKKELKSSHDIMEAAMEKLGKIIGNTKSGIKYYSGEPKFAMVITERSAFVNSYAESPSTQVVDLPIYSFKNTPGSLYGAFKRHFNDLWHNDSAFGNYQKEHIDLETSAGGIVITIENTKKYVALLRRDDGLWVLPKGHKLLTETSLETTARREVVEETGLKESDFFIEKPLGYYTYDETAERFNATRVNHVFLMRCTKNGRPQLATTEFAEARWWDITIPLPEMLYTYQKSYLSEVIRAELQKNF